jgi:hypothetical protein
VTHNHTGNQKFRIDSVSDIQLYYMYREDEDAGDAVRAMALFNMDYMSEVR